MQLTARALAKVNLSLGVSGRRADGYHEIESLVAFAGTGDVVTLDTGRPLGLELAGPEAAAITGDTNLVIAAAKAALGVAPDLQVGHFRLEKHLPVASGIGGGSADAAAALRLIREANPQAGCHVDWMALASRIGSDVPVCLASRASLMCGRGERLSTLDALPPAALVLANPRVALQTADVFKALAAHPLDAGRDVIAQVPNIATFEALTAYLQQRPNDLEPAAIALCPVIADVRRALATLSGAQLVRMSGSGATCFALFKDRALADAGASALASAHPGWWVRAAPLL